jgi:N-methylhydantoinase A
VQRFSLGIDIGGTFTDIVVYDTMTGRQSSHKELTTHDDPSRAVMSAIDRVMAAADIPAAAIARVVHATTLFTNALIECKGAVTGLITTEGFRDTLEIGRERKFELYDITIRKPEPLVPRNRRLGVVERMRADGMVLTPLDERSLLAAAEQLVGEGVTSLALVFLHSYANPRHERQALEALQKRFPKLALSASIEVAPEIREYERTSTTVANAYIKPLAERYLSTLADEIARRGITAPLLMMLSNGGLASAAEAKRSPVQLLESGPAAGALAAATLGAYDGGGHVLAFDMGGTTAKLSVVDDGRPKIAYAFEAARQKRFVEGSGLPIRISTIELIEIGAGGGSIAHLDEIGLLKVGPESAGSEPGPAGYGRGGTRPTVTDADLLLGYLNPDYFAGGTMHIDMTAVREALEPLAKEVGLSVTEIAWGIHDIVNENMANAARVHVAEHGKDPRRYALLSTGGAGPVHACHVARKLGLRTLIVPRSAGVASALGLLVAPARVDRVVTVAREVDQIDWHALEATFLRLESEARRVVAETGLDPASAAIERIADFRYVGQASELVVSLPPGPYGADSRNRLEAAFEVTYVKAFTRTPPSTPVEIINIRVTATVVPPGSAHALGATSASGGARMKKHRPVYFPEWREHRPTPAFDRDALSAGDRIEGPAIIEEGSSTLVIAPGCHAEVAASGNVIVTLGRDGRA